ncbi:sigma-70 family RNA polymerase sigma factor [Petralouisia muris]|jgi:RNA polymerase sigma-70 factor (ECF subfamily)|uniref:Sigma-70 family RNA polymerase sigma factor n=1 Tax=Petralouisia muris TaxID=3032872 RepID=A0AC61RTT3_9FIRM|nr:sigma-70 family RNA polymerase sigma factor [Petralouisia muris]TGY95156.1 sigma-70 family RNA polymerase sigma factor [Petralouisia muris]
MQDKASKDDDIYVKYANTVKRFLISLSGNFDLAEDLTQETFYQAYKSLHRYNGKCKMSVWLCQIAKHMYFDYLKKEKHIQKIEIENLKIFDTERNVEETYLLKEEIQELLFAVQQAKKTYGQVFWLRAYEEMTFKEIGEIFDKSENWARINYYRAKEWIRERIRLNNENNM